MDERSNILGLYEWKFMLCILWNFDGLVHFARPKFMFIMCTSLASTFLIIELFKNEWNYAVQRSSRSSFDGKSD